MTPQAMTPVQLVYHDVPAEVSKVSAYEWRPGSRPAAVPLTMMRRGADVTAIAGSRGQMFGLL